jgi:hypothetical protein
MTIFFFCRNIEVMRVKFVLLAIPLLAWCFIELTDYPSPENGLDKGARTVRTASSKSISLLSERKQKNAGTLNLVSDYAETFRNREKAQNSDYALAEQRFEERNERYIDEVAAYQKKKAALLKQQALRLEGSGRRIKHPRGRRHLRSRRSKF